MYGIHRVCRVEYFRNVYFTCNVRVYVRYKEGRVGCLGNVAYMWGWVCTKEVCRDYVHIN
jgi:hypothetical protein